MSKRWEVFEHPSPSGPLPGVRGSGPDLSTAFEMAGHALLATVADPDSISPQISVPIRCETVDLELLLADLLNTVIYEMNSRRMLFNRLQLRIEGIVLTGSLSGEALDPARHRIHRSRLLGAGFTALEVKEERGKIVAQCVLDDPRHLWTSE